MSAPSTEELNAALFLSARLDDARKASEALGLGASTGALMEGRTPLSVAAFYGSEEAMAELIKAGASVEMSLGEESSPLILAAQAGHAGCVKALLAAGAQPNALGVKSELSPLGAAAFGDHAQAAQALVDAGAVLDRVESISGTPLTMCALFNNLKTLRVLLEAGADPNARDKGGWTPLMCSCNTGNIEAAQALLDAGADPSARSKQGESAADIALKNDYKALAHLTLGAAARAERSELAAGVSPSALRASGPRV